LSLDTSSEGSGASRLEVRLAGYTQRRSVRSARVPPFVWAVVLALMMWAAIAGLIAAIVSVL